MNAIINVAVGKWYGMGQERLLMSLAQMGERAERLTWREVWPGRSHELSPYEFKLDAFDAAAAQHCGKALWCDASVWLVGPLNPVWAWLDRHGVFLLGDGWNLGQWSSDRALSLYGVDRETAMGVQLTYNAVVGIDLRSGIGREFLGWWRMLAARGAFVGPWSNENGEASSDPRCMGHRHDQSAASWLARRLSIPLAPIEEFLIFGYDGPDRVFRAQGM